MLELSKRSEAEVFFKDVVNKTKSIKIKSVSSHCNIYHSRTKYRVYQSDTPIYILFDDGHCLLIDYRFIDALGVDFKMITKKEIDELELARNDLFNYDYSNDDSSSLEYGSVMTIEIRTKNEKYSKWIGGDVELVSPNYETFDEIKFIMNNGNTFFISPADAEDDGYVMVWSTDAKEYTKWP